MDFTLLKKRGYNIFMSSINDSLFKIAETIRKSYSEINISEQFMSLAAKLQEQVDGIAKIYEPVILMQSQQQFVERVSQISKQLESSMKITSSFVNSIMISSSLEQLLKSLNLSYKELQKTFIQYDFAKLSKIIQNEISTYERNTLFDANAITDKIVETYIADTPEVIENDRGSEIKDRKESIKNIRDWVGFWVTIIGFMLSIYSLVNTKSSNAYSTAIEVNNYYVNDLEINANLLNAMSYRIIIENDVMPRIKPDCSSRAVGHLNVGQVVIVSRKYRKWVEINWEDKDGNIHSGWIQNYKLTEFK